MSDVYSIHNFGPSDLLTSAVEGERRVKTASLPAIGSAAINGMAYCFTASYSVPAGQHLALNMTLAADTIIHKVFVNGQYSIYLYNQHATGTADGIFSAVNRNSCSADETPASSQLYHAATAHGSVLDAGIGVIEPYVVADYDCLISAVTQNDTASEKIMVISVVFEEISPRAANFGLTASTLLEPSTEMSIYG